MSKEEWAVNSIPVLFPELEELRIYRILDLAGGLSNKAEKILYSSPHNASSFTVVVVDHFKPYLEVAKATSRYNHITYICADVMNAGEMFLSDSYEMVILFDILEHLPLEDAYNLIKTAERIATKAVIIETPNGEVKQDIDITGWGNHSGQTHRSAWNPEMLEALGYTVRLRDYKMQDVKRHTEIDVDPNIQLIDAIKLT